MTTTRPTTRQQLARALSSGLDKERQRATALALERDGERARAEEWRARCQQARDERDALRTARNDILKREADRVAALTKERNEARDERDAAKTELGRTRAERDHARQERDAARRIAKDGADGLAIADARIARAERAVLALASYIAQQER